MSKLMEMVGDMLAESRTKNVDGEYLLIGGRSIKAQWFLDSTVERTEQVSPMEIMEELRELVNRPFTIHGVPFFTDLSLDPDVIKLLRVESEKKVDTHPSLGFQL